MKMYVGTEWVDKPKTIPVLNPYDGSQVDTVPRADGDDIERALATAAHGARAMRRLTGYERYQILRKAADLMTQRPDDPARPITLEEGKTIGDARLEVPRPTHA